MASIQPLSYSALPPGSGTYFQADSEGIVITVRSGRRKAVWGITFALTAMVLVTVFGAFGVASIWRDINWVGDPPAIYYFKPIAIVICIATCWVATVLLIRMMVKRGATPTVLTVADGKLVLLTPELPVAQHEFALDSIKQLEVVGIGIGVNFRRCGELLVVGKNSVLLRMFRGRVREELEWIAKTLNGAIATRREGLGGEHKI